MLENFFLKGQNGWGEMPDGSRYPKYDAAVDVWECEREDRGTFYWRWKTHCYGAPAGSCNRVLQPYEHTYCRACATQHDRECKEYHRLEKRRNILTCAIEDGSMPEWFKSWQRPMIKPQQAAALVQLEGNENCCAFIEGLKGRGKTSLVSIVLSSYLDRCRTVAFAVGQTVYESRRNRNLYHALCTAELLVFDDIEKDNLHALNVAQIHNILSVREQGRLRTIATSEISMDNVSALFKNLSNDPHGTSTLDRLNFPKAPCLQIELTGENLRRTS